MAIAARSSTKEENPPSEDDVQSRVSADGLEESPECEESLALSRSQARDTLDLMA